MRRREEHGHGEGHGHVTMKRDSSSLQGSVGVGKQASKRSQGDSFWRVGQHSGWELQLCVKQKLFGSCLAKAEVPQTSGTQFSHL